MLEALKLYALIHHTLCLQKCHQKRKRTTFANILALDIVRIVLRRNRDMPGGHSGLRLQTKPLHTTVREHESDVDLWHSDTAHQSHTFEDTMVFWAVLYLCCTM